MRLTLDVPFEFKELTDAGKFSGIASIYGAVDLGGDVVERGAFAKTLAENPTVPILWQHDKGEVIGEGKMHGTREGLRVDGELDIDVDAVAQKAFNKMKRRRVRGLSIGYQNMKEPVFKNNIRHLVELKVWEISVVTFPMLPSAQVTSVKSAEEIEEFLETLWLSEPAIKAMIADQPELKQRFLSLLGEAGATTSAKAADTLPDEPLVIQHSALIEQMLKQRSTLYG